MFRHHKLKRNHYQDTLVNIVINSVNFNASSLSETETKFIPLFVMQLMKTEKIELCYLGEFGTAITNPPVEVRIVGDLFTTDTF